MENIIYQLQQWFISHSMELLLLLIISILWKGWWEIS